MASKLGLLAVLVVLGFVNQTFADEPEKIVGGQPAYLGEFPYQVSLRLNGNHICGGTLISNKHVVTAAHCIQGLVNPPYTNFQVVTGSTSIYNGGQAHKVQIVIVHSGYVPSPAQSYVNDIAVITLAAPVALNQYQSPISVATSNPAVNAPLQLSGWGMTQAGGRPSPNLLKATLYAMDNDKCQAYNSRNPIYPTHLCTHGQRGIGACQGDSGGPLVYGGQLVGVVSWVYPCALGLPDVFTRAPNYLSFIESAKR